jgi:superfamily II DNA or RNA helicase
VTDLAAITLGTGVRGIPGVRPFYEVPRDNIAGELLIPAMAAAERVRIMAGFFSSRSFSQLAPGLAAFINSDNEPLELQISPKISDEDREALRRAVLDPVAVAEAAMARLFEGALASASAIAAHVVDCLAYLVAHERVEVRFVLMEQGMFHPKVWLFESGTDIMAVHGSSNPTEAGLLYNGETVSVERPWHDGEVARERVKSLSEMFAAYWHNRREKSITVSASAGLPFAGNHKIDRVPTTDDFWRAWYQDMKDGLAPPLPENVNFPMQLMTSSVQRLETPPSLVWETGRFGHQGRAVKAWEAAGRRGVLAIATGGGKTVLSLVAATRLQNENDRPLLILVLAPSNPLIDQWETEAERFGARPYVLGRIPASDRISALHGIVTGLVHGVSQSDVIISSNQLFVGSQELREFLARLPSDIRTLIIGDEVHNLGTASFLDNAPEEIPYRLGLSATPIRQYDTSGTDRLFAFFGPTIFEFDLAEAIQSGCLTPYNYCLHEVVLSEYEMEEWQRQSAQLRKRGFLGQDDGQGGLPEGIQRLLEARRSVLEHTESKLTVLNTLLAATPASAVSRTLIYTSAKRDPLGRTKQIIQANRLLNRLGVISHQLTYSETGGPRARKIIDDFADGRYQALTCMKVLDEGLDVPATNHAYIMASSTVRREWVQRRGRILRVAPGKDRAYLHDFFVVPPEKDSREGRTILRAELQRADEFARLADNAWDNDGPRTVTERYE